MNVIAGVPRSGSSLLCNVLRQNPEFYVGATTALPEMLAGIQAVMSASEVFKSELIADAVANDRLLRAYRGCIEAWRPDTHKVWFSKSRAWPVLLPLVRELYPESKVILCVRDLRAVVGSIEKTDRKTAGTTLNNAPLIERASAVMAPTGVVGSSVVATTDVLLRKWPGVFVLAYEDFAAAPELCLRKLYSFLGRDYFEHDVHDVANTTTEVDALWLNKFPHVGAGPITPTDPNEWRAYMADSVGDLIYNRYPDYNDLFGYKRQ